MRDFFPFPEVKAFTSKKKARKCVKKITGKDVVFGGRYAQCSEYENDSTGRMLCVVVMYPACRDLGYAQKMAMLAHECVHVVKAWLDMMEADKPDEETVAYGVQCAMLECIDQIGEEWFRGKQER